MATDIMNSVTETLAYAWALTYGEYCATVEKIAKINDRAVAKGFTGHLAVVASREVRVNTDSLTGLQITDVIYHTSVVGDAPSYGGYTFLARIDRVGDTFTVNTAPGVEHVERSLVHAGECDHCGFNRTRNNTYLVRNDVTGETINVGSTCIKDFLGWSASVTFFGDSDLAPETGGIYCTPMYSLDTVLAISVAAIRAHGWVPASSYDGTPTRDIVSLVLSQRNLNDRERALVAALRPFVDEATSQVALIKAYVTSDDFAGASTYVENLKALFTQEFIGSRQLGLVVSAPSAYTRHLEKDAERKAAAVKTQGSEWVGAEKDKLEISGTIEAIRYSENMYGTTTIYTLLSEDGNLFTWFSSNGALGEDAGIAFHIKGTVKAHDEYRGVKSTVLTRCKDLTTG